MKQVVFLGGALAVMAGAMAAEVGLGLGVAQNASTVYVPIEVSPALRIEPYLNAYSFERKAMNSRGSSSQWSLGAGVFGVQPAGDGTRVFVGTRLGYITRKSSQTDGSQRFSDRATGMELAPTVGFEYDIHKNLSIGGEAGVAYSHLSGTSHYDTQKDDISESTTRTFTVVSIKYHFR